MGTIFRLSDPELQLFPQKNLADPSKSLPPPTAGVPSASKSPSALSAQALRARALDNENKICENNDNENNNYLMFIGFSSKIYSGKSNNIDDNYILCSLGSHQKVGKRTSRENHSRNINTTSHLQMKRQCNIFGKSYKLLSEFNSEVITGDHLKNHMIFDLNQSLLIIPSKNDNHMLNNVLKLKVKNCKVFWRPNKKPLNMLQHLIIKRLFI